MTTYKEVFQLAESKGYIPFGYTEYYELCRIQKWLRDTHGIDIEINNQFTNAKEGMEYFPVIYSPSIMRQVLQNCGKYESALLAGINAALKLIENEKDNKTD
jgi:hypothetical protein